MSIAGRRLARAKIGVELPDAVYPAQRLDLSSNWKIQLPIDSDGGYIGTSIEVKQPELATYHHPDWFKTANDGVIMRAPVEGAHTSGSQYARTEFREMTGSTTNAAWSITDGKAHTLQWTLTIDALPISLPRVVVGQCFNTTNGDMLLIVADGFRPASGTVAATGVSKTPFAIVPKFNGSFVAGSPLLADYVMGEVISIKMVAENNEIKVYCDRGSSATTLRYTVSNVTATYPSADTDCYFKAGCYNQSNTNNDGKTVSRGSCAGGADLTSPAAGSATGGDAPGVVPGITMIDLSVMHQ